MRDNTDALRLADALDARVVPRWVHATGQTPQQKGHTPDAECVAAAAELRRLVAENEQLRVALEKETAARREAQIHLAAAYEARNRAGIEFRRLAAKENAELVEALKAELAEQARLNGMGSEREARLMALNAELVEVLKYARAVFPQDKWADGTRRMIDAALAKAEASK